MPVARFQHSKGVSTEGTCQMKCTRDDGQVFLSFSCLDTFHRDTHLLEPWAEGMMGGHSSGGVMVEHAIRCGWDWHGLLQGVA